MFDGGKEYFMRAKDMDSPSQLGGMKCPQCDSDIYWSGDNEDDREDFRFFESTGWCPNCGAMIIWNHEWALESREAVPVSGKRLRDFDW